MSRGWKALIAERDVKVNRICELQAEIREIDEELEKDPPPEDRCVGVWTPSRQRRKTA
jgi:hypothetical protein